MRAAAAVLALATVAGCAGRVVRPEVEPHAGKLPRPGRVLVYEFATTPAEVHPDQDILRQIANRVQFPDVDTSGDAAVAAAFADALTARLRAFGIAAERAERGAPVHRFDVQIVGAFVAAHRSEQVGRVALGFEPGDTRLDAEVDVLQSSGRGRRRVAQFTARAADDEGAAALTDLAFVAADQAAHQVARVFTREGWR